MTDEPRDIDPITGEPVENESHPETDEEQARLNENPEGPAPEEVPPTAEELAAECHELLAEPSLLSVIDPTLRATGFAGPTWPVQLLTLSVYSRHLPNPVSMVVRGESAAGKSHAIKRAVGFASPEAIHTFTAMSPKALFYDKADYSHTMVVVYEGEGLNSDTVAYAMRSLLSEGRLEYRVTDFETKSTDTMIKEGPTGLITSTAGRVDYELGTRVFSIPIDDSQDVTEAIMRAEASQAEGTADEFDSAHFAALDRWMALNRKPVFVPFARKLSEATDGRAVRMRRDFSSVLGLIQAHALLHQTHREVDPAGNILASLADYEAIHPLVSDLVAYSSGKSVPPEIRETVELVRDLTLRNSEKHLTEAKIADKLRVHRTTVGRRLRRAMHMGYIVCEKQRGQAATYRWGQDDLPGDKSVLPHPDQLR